jgi:uncharacterized FlaG/YvyC family protein
MAPSSIEAAKPAVVQAPPPVVDSSQKVPVSEASRGSEPVPAPVASVSEEDLARIAKDIEKAFGSTKVTFEGAASGNANKIRFSVVDEKTGEVVLRFPLKDQSVQEAGLASRSKGILLDSKA